MHDDSYDVAVLGLGAWGSAAAYHLARRGRRVLGLDRYAPPHPHGSSHGRSRMIRQATPEGSGYAPMMVRGYELWDELSRETGSELIRRVGGLYAGPPGSETVEGALASYRDDDTPHEVLDGREAALRFPSFHFEEGEVAVFEPGGGSISPEDGVRAHLRGAARAGADLRVGEPVHEWHSDGETAEVTTPAGRYSAERLVLCLGPWAPDLLGLRLPLAVERQVVVWLEGPAPHGFPVFILPCEPPAEVFYGMPEPEGTVKVALHHGGVNVHPDDVLREIADDDVEAVQAVARRRLPGIGSKVVDALTCLYTNTPDRHFVVDVHPQHRNVVFATGDSGRGFKLAPAVGELLADLAGGEARPDADFLSSARFG